MGHWHPSIIWYPVGDNRFDEGFLSAEAPIWSFVQNGARFFSGLPRRLGFLVAGSPMDAPR